MICKAPWRCCARPRSTCRCSSITSATEPHQRRARAAAICAHRPAVASTTLGPRRLRA
jgi:hypothetical protein